MTEATPPTRHVDDGVTFLHVNHLIESRTNPRRMFDPKRLAELTESVRQHGIVQALLVRPVGEDFELVAGSRRYRAAKDAGLLEVPCFVRTLTDKQALELQIVENEHRDGVHPVDEGAAFRRLIDEHGYTVELLADKLNRSPRFVYGRMALANLPVKVLELFVNGKIELSIAQLLTTVAPELVDQAAKEIEGGWWDSDGPMSFRQARALVREMYQCELKSAPFDTGDATLVPEAGACGKCPHSTANQRGLFDQVEDAAKTPAMCTRPECFAAKRGAAFDRRAAEVLGTGGKVVRGKDGEKHRYAGVDLDATACWKDDKRQTYRAVLGKKAAAKLAVTLVEGSGGRAAVERVDPKVLSAALKDAGKGDLAKGLGGGAASSARSSNPQLAAQQGHRLRMAAFDSVLPAIAESAAALDSVTAWALVIRHVLTQRCNTGTVRVGKRRGVKLQTSAETLLDLPVQDLQSIALEIVACNDVRSTYSGAGARGFNDATSAIARACGVDLAKALRDQKAAKDAAKKKGKVAKVAPAKKPAGKRKKAARAKRKEVQPGAAP